MKIVKSFFLLVLLSLSLGAIAAFACEGSISSVNAGGEGVSASCILQYQWQGECYYDCYCNTPDGDACDRELAAIGISVY